MANQLDTYVEKQICVITTDGKYYSGTLKGFDQAVNLFLIDSTLTSWSPIREDVFTDNIIIRGDTVVLIALKSSTSLPTESKEIPSII